MQETQRQYRVLRQTLSIHAMLRDEFARKACIAELLLLICSVIFCATTFAGDEFYQFLRLDPQNGQIILGFASVIAFSFSLTLMALGWKGKAALHREAVTRWTSTLAEFHRHRGEDRDWPAEVCQKLSSMYWEADRNSTDIPEGRFTRLKARYLRKVQLSKLRDLYPGCPHLILVLILRAKDTIGAISGLLAKREQEEGRASDGEKEETG